MSGGNVKKIADKLWNRLHAAAGSTDAEQIAQNAKAIRESYLRDALVTASGDDNGRDVPDR